LRREGEGEGKIITVPKHHAMEE